MLSISPLRAAIFLSAVHMAVWQSDLKGLVAIAIKTPGLPDLHWCCPRCSDLHPVEYLFYIQGTPEIGEGDARNYRLPLINAVPSSLWCREEVLSPSLSQQIFFHQSYLIGYGGRGGVVFLSGKVNLIYCVLSDVLVLLFFKNIWLEHIMIYTVACVPLNNIIYCCPF